MPKRILFLLVALLAAIAFTDVGKHYTYSLITNVMSNQSVPAVDPEEVYAMEGPYTLLDVRTPGEYKVSRLQGARFVNYQNFQLKDVSDLPKDERLVLYCTFGARSAKIGAELQEAGFTKVHNLRGGIINWVNNGFPVYDAAGKTDRIHGYSDFWGYWITEGEKVYEP